MNAPDWIWFSFVFAVGCCIGSFLNVVIYRLPREKSLVHPGSACPSCSTPIHFYNNIPLVSWLLLGAKCPNCKASISARYFVIELLTGLLYLGVAKVSTKDVYRYVAYVSHAVAVWQLVFMLNLGFEFPLLAVSVAGLLLVVLSAFLRKTEMFAAY